MKDLLAIACGMLAYGLVAVIFGGILTGAAVVFGSACGGLPMSPVWLFLATTGFAVLIISELILRYIIHARRGD